MPTLFPLETNCFSMPSKSHQPSTRLPHKQCLGSYMTERRYIVWKWPEGDLNPPPQPWKGCVLTSRLSGLNLLCFILTSNQSWLFEMETRFFFGGCLHPSLGIYLVSPTLRVSLASDKEGCSMLALNGNIKPLLASLGLPPRRYLQTGGKVQRGFEPPSPTR